MKIKVLADSFPGMTRDEIVEVPEVDGIPSEQFWRRRLKDAQTDGCCEVVQPEPEKSSKKRSQTKSVTKPTKEE